MDGTISKVNQNSSLISELHTRLEDAHTKIKDLENRSHRYNVRIRGLPEYIIHLEKAVQTLMKDLIPDILPHRFKIDIQDSSSLNCS